MESHKILVCGDIGGNFQTLYKRVTAVNKSNGPFDLLLCVGSFFEPFNEQHNNNYSKNSSGGDNESTTEEDANDKLEFPTQLQSYKDETETIPIPTYFIAYTNKDLSYINKFGDSTTGEICKGITYLGKSGIKNINNLNIAYLSGKVDYPISELPSQDDEITITKSDIDNIIKESNEKRIDILLSNQWGRGVLNNVQSGIPSFIKTPYKLGMDGIKFVVQALSPAYHFSKNSFYFQRPPYLNNSTVTQLTRFLSLAPVYNDKKEKYLFAMNYQPTKEINKDDATPNPFEWKRTQSDDTNNSSGNSNEQFQKRQRTSDDSSTNFFFGNAGNNNNNNNSNNNNNYNGKRPFNNSSGINISGGGNGMQYQQHQHHQRHQQQEDVNCWFCLSSPEVDSHLVVTIGSESYLAFPKGGVNKHHLLVVYTEHKPNYISLSMEERADVQIMIDCLVDYFDKMDQDIVIFERNVQLKGMVNHGHLQVVPIPRELSKNVKKTFIKHASVQPLMKFIDLNPDDNIDQILNDQLYFLVFLPGGEKMYSLLPQKSEFQFGRKVLTDLLGTPERLNWKDCAESKENETRSTLEFRTSFQPFYDKRLSGNSNDDSNDEDN